VLLESGFNLSDLSFQFFNRLSSLHIPKA